MNFQMVLGLILIAVHLLLCLGICLGIRTGFLKVKKSILPFVFLVPVWGILLVGLLHLRPGLLTGRRREVGLEKLKLNEAAYHSVLSGEQQGREEIVPLEESLIINDPSLRRNMIMDVLNDNPAEYIQLLKQARMNEDVEVVHYASTAMAELSKQYDFRLMELERAYGANPEDEEALSQYSGFLGEYIRQGMVQGRMERVQRNQYSALLRKQLQRKEELPVGIRLVENLLHLGKYGDAESVISMLEKNWPEDQQVWMLKLQSRVRQKDGDGLQVLLAEMERRHIYLSAENRELLEFWQRDGKN
ncbi:MAG: hypothetical protein Q4F29_04720 [Lachnospiraceae bacterium]|nr:hypothetical protein [Lachnospiraceae bacterium]